MKRILLSTASYQDTPGAHHEVLESQGYEIVRERGPLDEEKMLELAGELDGLLCGDDTLNRKVIEKMLPRLKVISKYGIGLDKIDLEACNEHKIPVLFTPGVNHTTVAEHTFCILLASVRHLVESVNHTRKGEWKRITGNELWQKKLGIIGLGRIGQEVARRGQGFQMELHGFGNYWDEKLLKPFGIQRHDSVDELFKSVNVVTLHTKLNDATRGLVNADRLNSMSDGSIIVNTGRGELVDADAIIAALDSGKLAAYACDVLDEEPPPANHPLLHHPKVLVTPHIGSRTYESVPRQAMKATKNLINWFNGDEPVFQANSF